MKRIVRLETGSHYWWRHKRERIWRVCYIGNDHDHNQWLHPVDSPPTKIADMDLSCFDWQEINQPNAPIKSCTWTEDAYGNWNTGCQEIHIFISGTPHENDYVYCPYCGGQIRLTGGEVDA